MDDQTRGGCGILASETRASPQIRTSTPASQQLEARSARFLLVVVLLLRLTHSLSLSRVAGAHVTLRLVFFAAHSLPSNNRSIARPTTDPPTDRRSFWCALLLLLSHSHPHSLACCRRLLGLVIVCLQALDDLALISINNCAAAVCHVRLRRVPFFPTFLLPINDNDRAKCIHSLLVRLAMRAAATATAASKHTVRWT